MQNRDYKIFKPDHYYHIFNRGNNKQDIFLDDQDYLNFLKRLKFTLGLSDQKSGLRITPLPLNSFSIVAYCLMPNHFHFLIKQNAQVGIDRLVSRVCTSYGSYFNKKYNRVGHWLQDAFKAKVVDSDEYLLHLSAYIHNNPDNPFAYDYSSLPDILGKRAGQLCERSLLLNYVGNITEKYESFVKNFTKEKEKTIQHLLLD